MRVWVCVLFGLSLDPSLLAAQIGSRVALWKDGTATSFLLLPSSDKQASSLASSTFSYNLGQFYGLQLPLANGDEKAGTYIVLGTPANNPALNNLVQSGLKLTKEDIGDEGFQLLTYQKGASRYVIAYGKTPRALKFASQELIFYLMPATRSAGHVYWPINEVRRPAFTYRCIYMLPCWSPGDSMESWQRVLRFNSELTLNRTWFWLDGFPLAGHKGLYKGTPLSDAGNVQSLIDLVNSEDMKFYIGGGWLTWHMAKEVGTDLKKAQDYYLEYLRTFRDFSGFYLEPTGEPTAEAGKVTAQQSNNWRAEAQALRSLTRTVAQRRSQFEFAVAIGQYNSREYLAEMAKLDPKHVYWWWCWGHPVRDYASSLFPKILAWQSSFFSPSNDQSEWGTRSAPGPEMKGLSGIVTSYDPGAGWGNPWNGLPSKIEWQTMIPTPGARNFDPYTIPYFYLQYFVRERAWNLGLSEQQFSERLLRRLFDGDAPTEAGQQYVKLSQMALRADDGKPISRAGLATA